MNIIDLISSSKLDNTFLVGYFGGTNYGDELLLETLQCLFFDKNVQNVHIYYMKPENFQNYHHDFGYKIVDGRNKFSIFKAMLRSKNIVIGGGGIWGLDANLNTLILGIFLAISGIFFQKKIYLLGVGYYKSTTYLGHVSAFLSGNVAKYVFARDYETYENFRKYNKNTILDKDISFYIPTHISLAKYKDEAQNIIQKMHFDEKRTLVGLRRFQAKYDNMYNTIIQEVVKKSPKVNFTVLIFESKIMAREIYASYEKTQHSSLNVIVSAYDFNPLAFYLAIKLSRANLKIIAPQYHAQITAYLNEVPFLAIDYDAKNREFFKIIHRDYFLNINTITTEQVLNFIEDK